VAAQKKADDVAFAGSTMGPTAEEISQHERDVESRKRGEP
jgi:hypothetical protein